MQNTNVFKVRCRQPFSPFGASGTTAFGLLGALAIVSAVVLTARVSFSTLVASYQLRAGARRVFSELQAARMAAVKENNPYIFLRNDDSRYSLCDDENRNTVCDAGEVRSTGAIGDGQLRFSVSTGAVRFLPDGTAASAATITVIGVRGGQATVSVSTSGS